jgi:hypothetical protein
MENTHQEEVKTLSNILDILEVYCRHTLLNNKSSTNIKTLKNLTFVKTQQRDLMKRFIFLGLSFFFLSLVFGILFRISGSNLIQIIAAFFLLLLVVSAIYFPYSFLFSAWRNTKSKKENIRNNFLLFKQENNIYINTLNRESRNNKEILDKLLSSQKLLNEKIDICIKELNSFELKFLKDLQIDFERKLDESKKLQAIVSDSWGQLTLFILLTLFLYIFGLEALNKLIGSDPYYKFLGASIIVLLFLGLWKLAFSLDTLPIKIYEESIYLLKKAINQHHTSMQIPITESKKIGEFIKNSILEKLIEEEDYGLAKLMEEVDNDEVLSKSEALAYLQLLKKDGLDS